MEFPKDRSAKKRDIYICLILAWIPLLCMAFSHIKSEQVARFGSVMVFFGAAGEYMLMNNKMKNLYRAIEIASRPNTDVIVDDTSTYISFALHITVLSGTLIWGYGDYFVDFARSVWF